MECAQIYLLVVSLFLPVHVTGDCAYRELLLSVVGIARMFNGWRPLTNDVDADADNAAGNGGDGVGGDGGDDHNDGGGYNF